MSAAPAAPAPWMRGSRRRCALILRGPDPKRDGCREWRIADLCRAVEERFGVGYAETGMLRLVKSLDLSWQKARPRHPRTDPRAQARFKGGCPA